MGRGHRIPFTRGARRAEWALAALLAPAFVYLFWLYNHTEYRWQQESIEVPGSGQSGAVLRYLPEAPERRLNQQEIEREPVRAVEGPGYPVLGSILVLYLWLLFRRRPGDDEIVGEFTDYD